MKTREPSSRQEAKRIFLLRHAHVGDGRVKRYIGQTDLALSERGIAQARRLADFFASVPIAGIFSSDLKRAVQTAEIIAAVHSLQVQIEPGLREIHLGEWEGLAFSDVMRNFSEEYERRGADIVNHRLPGGESFRDLQERVYPVFQKITGEAEGNLIIVGHAGVNRVILCELLGMPLGNLLRIGQNHGCINETYPHAGSYRIQTLNRTLD